MVDQLPMRMSRGLLLSLLFGLSGCLEYQQTVTVEADGSGSQTVRLAIKDATLADLERSGSAAETTKDLTKGLFDKELLGKELAAAGLTLQAHQSERKANRRTVELTAAFPSFAALQQSPLAGSRAVWELAAGPKPGTAKLTLYPQGKEAWTEARAKAEAMRTEGDAVAEAFFRKKQQEIAGLDVTLRFRVPGEVLMCTANMDKTGPREVTARVTADQIKTPQDLVRRLAPRFEVIFDATGTKLTLQ